MNLKMGFNVLRELKLVYFVGFVKCNYVALLKWFCLMFWMKDCFHLCRDLCMFHLYSLQTIWNTWFVCIQVHFLFIPTEYLFSEWRQFCFYFSEATLRYSSALNVAWHCIPSWFSLSVFDGKESEVSLLCS